MIMYVVTCTSRKDGRVDAVYGPYSAEEAKEICLHLRREEEKERPMLFYFNVSALEPAPST